MSEDSDSEEKKEESDSDEAYEPNKGKKAITTMRMVNSSKAVLNIRILSSSSVRYGVRCHFVKCTFSHSPDGQQ